MPVTIDPNALTRLTEGQQKAAHAFAKKYGTPVNLVAAHLGDFFAYDSKRISRFEWERRLGLRRPMAQTASLFEEAK